MKISEKAKSIILIVISVIIAIGIVIMAKFGFNTSLEYSDNVKVKIELGQDYDLADIKNIASESLGDKKYKVQTVEAFNEAVAITTSDISDDELQTLKDKINEKYQLDDVEKAVTKLDYSAVSVRDIVKNYIMPAYIVMVTCMLYLMIRYHKVGLLTVIYDLLKNTILGQGLYFSFVALTRIPVNGLLMPISAILFILSIIFTIEELKKAPVKVVKKVEKAEEE